MTEVYFEDCKKVLERRLKKDKIVGLECTCRKWRWSHDITTDSFECDKCGYFITMACSECGNPIIQSRYNKRTCVACDVGNSENYTSKQVSKLFERYEKSTLCERSLREAFSLRDNDIIDEIADDIIDYKDVEYRGNKLTIHITSPVHEPYYPVCNRCYEDIYERYFWLYERDGIWRQWCYMCIIDDIMEVETNLWKPWIMEGIDYENYMQFLPEEVMEDVADMSF